ncbi:MAG: phosphoenolpyruvate synthase [Patescibacteria group bacterium]
MPTKKQVLWFSDLGIKDVPKVGGKNASLGEMYAKLSKKGVRVPNGFATTADAYHHFMKEAGIEDDIRRILSDLNVKNLRNLQTRGKKVRDLILKSDLIPEFEKEIVAAYKKMSKQYKMKNVDVAVRSSATAEDLPDASFAGQQETFLNVTGAEDLLVAVKRCIASLFTDRAIAYREEKKFDHFDIALSVGVQKMVRSDLASSGVMFSIDTESGFENVVLINAIYGLGEYMVQGIVTPDEYFVFKPTLEMKNKNAVISKTLGAKKRKLVYNLKSSSDPVKNATVKPEDRDSFVLTDKEIMQLAKWAVQIEKHYDKPMDMEWAKDGRTGELFIVQARPETVQSQRDYAVVEKYKLQETGKLLTQGAAVGNKIGTGKANVILDVKDIHNFKPGEVLVTDMTDPDWVPIMKQAGAIVTDKGGRTSHAAIVSRELGIPAVVGTKDATKAIKTGREITVSCAEGEFGKIYEGKRKFTINKTNIKNLKKPKVQMMMIVGEPDQAFNFSFIPNDGVGLAREEFIVNTYIKIHPQALLDYKSLKDKKVIKQIDQITAGYDDKKQFYVDKLAEGIARIAAAFYPKDVIVRLSDFKTNEYANLIGGTAYEPEEENPMLGWRGSSRYYDPKFIEVFKLECQALKKVRETMGLSNVKIMIPFVRTLDEAKKVIKIMNSQGLKRGKNGLELYMMVEIPANVILAEKFAKLFDGFSIGSNDLTQLTLGLDRDSGIVAHVGNENNEALHEFFKQAIAVAKKTKTKIGICGQGPSDYPELAEFLMKQGIDSISLSPDSVIPTMVKLGKRGKRR